MHPVLGVFFISKPTLDNVSAIKAILRSFELVSGLRINFAKSQFGAIGQSEEWCSLAADFLWSPAVPIHILRDAYRC